MSCLFFPSRWSENEIRSSSFPFMLGFPFKIVFAFTSNEVMCAVNGIQLMNFFLDYIDVGSNDSLWEILTGFRVKNGIDTNVKINSVEVVQTGDKNVANYEKFSQLN